MATAVAASAAQVRQGARSGRRVRHAAAGLGAGTLVASVASAGGGYFPTSWGWTSLALLWTAAVALVVCSDVRLRRREVLAVAAWGALALWIWGSIAWSADAPQSVLEGERALVPLAGILAVLLCARPSSARPLLGGLLAGIAGVCGYALATRLVPDRLGRFDPVAGYRLAAPLGYWNALAIFAVLGVLLALGFAARGRGLGVRALAAASLVVLAPTLYFTFSRGAWVALAAGVAAAIALDRRRLQLVTTLLVVAPAPAAAVWVASRSDPLTRQHSSLAAAARDGHRLALGILGLAVVTACFSLALRLAEQRLPARSRVRGAYGAALLLVLVAALGAAVVHEGGPASLARRGYSSFTATPVRTHGDLNKRLFSFSGNGRPALWHAAWRDYVAHPLLGSGAGSFEGFWLRHRQTQLTVRDAHSLYVETLAELGPIGLALLLLALGVPLAAAAKARRHPLVPAAAGAYVAFLVHAGMDWDWEMTAVTLAALLCGTALLLAARTDKEARPLSPRLRAGALGATLLLAAVAFVGLVGNMALARSADAAAADRWAQAESQARRAQSWAPWSAEPWARIGEAQLARNEPAAARADFRRAIARDPGNWSLWFDLARAGDRSALAQAAGLDPLGPEIGELRAELSHQTTIDVAGPSR